MGEWAAGPSPGAATCPPCKATAACLGAVQVSALALLVYPHLDLCTALLWLYLLHSVLLYAILGCSARPHYCISVIVIQPLIESTGPGGRAFSGLHDIAYRANSETDLGKQVADAQAAGMIGPGSGGSLPHGFGMPGSASPDLVNAHLPEGSSGPLQLNGYDIQGAQGRQQQMQPTRVGLA